MDPDKEHFRFYSFTRMKQGYDASDIHQELQGVWNEKCPSERTVRRWCENFRKEEHPSFSDKERSGRPRSSRTDENIETIRTLIEDDPKLSTHDLEDAVGLCHATILRILKEDLNLRNVCSVWVPHLLSPENKQQRINCAKHIRRTLLATDWRNNYAVQDETYVNFLPQTNKSQNRTWIAKDARRLQVVRPALSNKKCLLMVAFTPNKRFSVSALPYGETVDAQRMVDFIRHTGDKWRTLRSAPIRLEQLLWQMDNARPHSAKMTKEFLERRQVTSVWQSPYSPDLNLCDRFLFRWLKADLGKQVFSNHKEVEEASLQALRLIPEDSLVAEVEKLLAHCQSVIDIAGEYVTE
jgi:transposase